MKVETKPLTPRRWPDFEALFESARGVCGGCWCTFWRVEKGESYEALKGKKAKARIKKLITSGKAHGILAYVDGECVGWLSFDRRPEYPKLDRAPSTGPIDDAARVWSLPCFFVKAGFRGKGVATALLEAGQKEIRKLAKKGEVMESYPEKVTGKGSAAFLYTGTIPLFEKQGFELVQIRPHGRQRMRKRI